MKSNGSNPFTSPAIFTGKFVVSKRVIVPIPDFPAIIPPQLSFNPIPKGVIKPSPVTTTFLFSL
jgi:hypothetical protein